MFVNNVKVVSGLQIRGGGSVAVAIAITASALLSGCETQPKKTTGVISEQHELQKALTEAAQRAVDVRVGLARMSAAAATSGSLQSATEPIIPAQARIDIDYVGPVESATRLIGRTLGWEVTVNGKKRQEVIVSLRHERQDSITILRDIGAQCGNKCDVHAEVVEGGKSSIALTYRD